MGFSRNRLTVSDSGQLSITAYKPGASKNDDTDDNEDEEDEDDAEEYADDMDWLTDGGFLGPEAIKREKMPKRDDYSDERAYETAVFQSWLNGFDELLLELAPYLSESLVILGLWWRDPEC